MKKATNGHTALSGRELRDLSALSNFRNIRAILADYAGVAAIFAANCVWQHWYLVAPSAVLIARQQFALGVLTHEAVHFRLFRNRKLNDFAGALISAPLFVPFARFRAIHTKHHGNPLTYSMPKSGIYPQSKARFLYLLLEDLTCVSYFKLVHYLLTQKEFQGSIRRDLLMGLISNAFLVLLFVSLKCPAYYFLLWWLPNATALQALLRVRAAVEHGGYEESRQPDDQSLNTRTVDSPIQAFFLGPHNANFHIEHHLFPSIPWYKLPRAHQALMRNELLPSRYVYKSYSNVFSEILI